MTAGFLSGGLWMMLKPRYDWMVWAAAAAAVVSLGVNASRVFRTLTDQGTGAVVQGSPAAVPEPQVAMDGILALMPFGHPVAAPPPGAAPGSDPRLTLVGIVRAHPISRSSAILSVGKEPARSFVVGDEIAGGRRLVEVQSDQILLEVDDRKEILSLTTVSPPVLPLSDGVSRAAGATGDLDALRRLIFDQVNDQGGTTADPSPAERVQN